MWVHAQLLQSCLTLWGSMDHSSSIHGILQARILEWIAMPSSKGSSWPREWSNISCISCIANRFFTDEPPGKPFSYDETGVIYFSKKDQRGTVSFSSCQYWWRCQHDLSLLMLTLITWVRSVRFLHCKTTCFSSFPFCPLWKKVATHSPFLRSGE